MNVDGDCAVAVERVEGAVGVAAIRTTRASVDATTHSESTLRRA